MAVRTKEELIDKIHKEHAWRLKEIAEIKRLTGSCSMDSARTNMLRRAGIALLYAHWEGFVKNAGSCLLKYISSQRFKMSDLKSNFIALYMKQKYGDAAKSSTYSAFEPVAEELIAKRAGRIRIPHKNIIATKSNLTSNVLREIAWCLGIDYAEFETKNKFIDEILIGRRNRIAHGEEVYVKDSDEMAGMIDEVLTLMRLFKNQVENCAVRETYKRIPGNSKQSGDRGVPM